MIFFSMLMEVFVTIKGASLNHQVFLCRSAEIYKKVPLGMIQILLIACCSEKHIYKK